MSLQGSQTWETTYVSAELTENLAELFPGLTLDEALQHQESLYQSLKISFVNAMARSSEDGQSSSLGHSLGETSLLGSGDFELDLDEALARSLQELDLIDDVDHFAVAQPANNAASSLERAAAGSSAMREDQDDLDPDQMTYEELRSLGEVIGSESRGLTEAEISSLPCYKYRYKTGFFAKKVEHGECAICYESYKNKESVTSLPCLHQYHTECIIRWLKQSKSCPICQKEVNFLC